MLRPPREPEVRPPLPPAPPAVPLAPPLLLLPLRLEYRLVERNERLVLTSVDMRTIDGRAAPVPRDPRFRVPPSPLRFEALRPAGRELWVRWYPDDSFAEEALEPPTADERAALARFVREIGTRPWFDTADAVVVEAWQRFATLVGPHRALYLTRSRGQDHPADWRDASGRMFGLPERVGVFALRGTSLTRIAEGRPVPDDLRYSPLALKADDWLTNFTIAVERGMGVRIADRAMVDAALAADWVIAVGLRGSDRPTDAAAFLRNGISRGGFALVPQDSPTNNTGRGASPFQLEPQDTIAFLRDSTFLERRDTSAPPTDADALAEALAVTPAAIYGAPGAAERGGAAAEAMARALLPGLLQGSTPLLQQVAVSRDDLTEFLARYAVARGPLPAVRFGRHPFGVLPLVRPGLVQAVDPADQAVVDLVKDIGLTTVQSAEERAADLGVIQPDGTDHAAILREVLQVHAVSTRVDVATIAGTKGREQLGCPLVAGAGWAPKQYLQDLQARPLGELPRPDEGDRTAPLLYRLLLLSLEMVSGGGGPGMAGFHAALARLADLAVKDLEILMIEVLDLLHSRGDAWLTALATYRLRSQRAAERRGLRVGYYGFLGRLRPTVPTGTSHGYIQAPSLPQAVTAGLLRAAARRYDGTGPFAVNLTSDRVRRALQLVDHIGQGVPVAEALGYRAERWLHDRGVDAIVFALRDIYPLPRGADSTERYDRLIDGLGLLRGKASELAGLSAADKAVVAALRRQLEDDLDALSDVLVAEAVHHLALGDRGAANAWIQVLSGGPIPGTPAFVRVQREGQGSTHRVACVLEPAPPDDGSPRGQVEPVLAALTGRILPEFQAATVAVRIKPPQGAPSAAEFSLTLSLGGDLGLRPIDLVIGGASAIVLRARFEILRRWRTSTPMQQHLGTLPETNVSEFINQDAPVTIDLFAGEPSAAALLAVAARLRQVVERSRPLEPADLNAATRPDLAMTAADVAAQLQRTSDLLGTRATRLAERVEAARAALALAARRVEDAAREVARRMEAAESPDRIRSASSALESRREALDQALITAWRFGLPEALVPSTTQELVIDLEARVEALGRLVTALATKRDALTAAAALAAPPSPGSRDLERIRDARVNALRDACDGEALPVWPAFVQGPKTTPRLDRLPDVKPLLTRWSRVRPRLAPLAQLLDATSPLVGWTAMEDVTRAATEGPTTGARTETERPRVRYYGTYLGFENGALTRLAGGTEVFAGFVLDEWSEHRPSAVQTTGVAVNYDAPQSEPPHVLILGVAEHARRGTWIAEDAAALVAEAIRLMKARAVPAQEASFAALLGRVFGIVPGYAGRRPRRRLPTGRGKFAGVGAALADTVKVLRGAPPPAADRPQGWTERERGGT